MINGTSHKDFMQELDAYEKREIINKINRENMIEKILKETPIAIRPLIVMKDSKYTYTAKGVTLKIPYHVSGISKFGIGLSHECDNMGKTLIHEALHVAQPDISEKQIEELTEIYWNKYPTIRKLAVRTIIQKLGENNL